MKINCIDKEIRKVFETGYYHIPRFQRPYSWEKEHIAEFWGDSVKENESDYFIGSIVVFKKSNEAFGIVDGQQRLTTITMILCALRDAYKIEGFPNLAKGVQSLIEKVDLNNDHQYILQTETSFPYFQEHIQKYDDPELAVDLGSEEVNLKIGFEQIQGYLQDEVKRIRDNRQLQPDDVKLVIHDKLNEIRDKVLKLKVIYIELDDEDDAYIIFETLNTRGKDLAVGDLVKNYLLKLIKTKNTSVDIAKVQWNRIRENVEGTEADIDLDTFLLHVWLSKYDYTTIKTLFKKVKSSIKKTQANEFLDELEKDSRTYRAIFDTNTRSWNKNELEIRKSLSNLYAFRVTQQTPMVLALMRAYDSKLLGFKHTRQALEAIEHFHYIFTAITSQRSSGGIGTMYSTYGRKLTDAKDEHERIYVISELKQKMREKLPTFDEFQASFKTFKYTSSYTKQKKIIHYTLAKIDKYFNKGGLAIDYDAMTLEHILPQRPNSKDDDHELVCGLIGNLLLVNQQTNQLLDNKGFLEKKKILEESSVFLDDPLLAANAWQAQGIYERTDFLAEKAYRSVFKI